MQFVISKNLKRRHLDESQRGAVAARIATLKKGRPSKENRQIYPLSQSSAAKMLNVSSKTVRHASKVLKSGDAELIREVDEGKKAASAAAKEIAVLEGLGTPAPDHAAIET